MISQTSIYGLVALMAVGAVAGPSAAPFKDSACQVPVDNWSYNGKNGTVKNGPFETGLGTSAGYSVSGLYNFETYSNIVFDVPSSSKSQGQKVYWKMNNLDASCRVLFMKPYSQDGQTTVPGSVVLNAGDPDYCYYVDPYQKLHMAFCCGTDDCAAFDIGLTDINPIDQPKDANKGPSASVAHALGQSAKAQTGKAQTHSKRHQDQSHGSLAARAAAEARRSIQTREALAARDDAKTCSDQDCYDREWAKCTSKVTGNPISQPGKQVPVGSWQDCPVAQPCPNTRENTDTYSYEVSVSSTETEGTSSTQEQSSSETNSNTAEVTNTDGYSMSVGGGVHIGPVDISSDFTKDHSTTTDNTNTHTNTQEQSSSVGFSRSVANSSGHSITNAKSESMSQTLYVEPGAHAVLTFTPFYNCYPVEVDCGISSPFNLIYGDHNVSVPVLKTQICEPAVVDGAVNGEYLFMYSNPSSGQT